jgi:hypothetical protein
MDTTESSAPHAHPSTEDHDDTVEAHYSCLERPCACIDGWVSSATWTRTARREKPPTPAAVAQLVHADLRRDWGMAKPTIPHSPLARLVSKHTPYLRTSPIALERNHSFAVCARTLLGTTI